MQTPEEIVIPLGFKPHYREASILLPSISFSSGFDPVFEEELTRFWITAPTMFMFDATNDMFIIRLSFLGFGFSYSESDENKVSEEDSNVV